MFKRAGQCGRRRCVGLLAGLLLGMGASSCRQPAAPAPLRIAHESGVISLDPHANPESATQSVLSNICEGVVSFDRDMRLRPAIVSTWSTPDETTWMLQLRPGVRFHDGRALSARDVKYSLDRARLDPASGIRGHLSGVESVDVVDDQVLRLRTLAPEPLLMSRLTYVCIVPAATGPYDAERLVSTGPYRMVEWKKGTSLMTEAWEGYWGGRAPIARVEFVRTEEGPRVLAPLEHGTADVLRWVPETMLDQARALKGVRVVSRSGLSTYYVWINSLTSAGPNPFADARVRRALSQAIDRAAIVQALGGNGTPATQLVPPAIFGYVAGAAIPTYDPEAARRLLAEAGFPRGLDATLVHRSAPPLPDVAEIIRRQAAGAGVRLTLKAPPWPEVVADWQAARLPLLLAAWRFEDGDAAGFLRDTLVTRDPVRNHGSVNPGYSNPALDALIAENSRTFGDAKRLKQYEKLMRLAMEEMPLVPLYHKTNIYGVAERVVWQPRLDGRLLAAEMTLK